MARSARATIIGYPHQVTQRGNYDQPVFEADADYRRYLAWLAELAARYALDVWAYCLMPNHVHYVCVPKEEGALARTFNTLHMRYAQHINKRRGVAGHLWRGRFLSCVLDERSVFEEVRHIENNPVRHGLVNRPEKYRWSSAPNHVLGVADPVLSDGNIMTSGNGSLRIRDWAAYLAAPANAPTVARTWERLKTGRPAGDARFVKEMESLTGRVLAGRPRGRPRKATQVL